MAAIERSETGDQTGEIGIWAENWDIVAAFAAVITQWRTAAFASGHLHYIGLDYTAVRARFPDITPQRWDDLSVMEVAFREAANTR